MNALDNSLCASCETSEILKFEHEKNFSWYYSDYDNSRFLNLEF